MKPPENPWTKRELRHFKKPFDLLPACNLSLAGIWADLGCGHGLFSAGLAHLLGPAGRVLAIDIDRPPLQRMQQLAATTDWDSRIWQLQADIRQPLPFANLDGLLAANVLHFLPDQEKAVVLSRLRNKVKPGGAILIVEYNHNRSTTAVPHPLAADAWLHLLSDSGWAKPQLCARTPSSYLGEMVALTATRPLK